MERSESENKMKVVEAEHLESFSAVLLNVTDSYRLEFKSKKTH